jgi:hypothetical protein
MVMASYSVNPAAVAQAQWLIDARQYVLDTVGLIACEHRAAEWRNKAIELAAHELLQRLDKHAGLG